MTTVMIVHSACGIVGCILVHTFMIAWPVFAITNNLIQIVSSYEYYPILKLSITASLYSSRVYIGMYIPDCMISDNMIAHMHSSNNLKQIVSSNAYYEVIINSIFIW